jgi:hypothetical protein
MKQAMAQGGGTHLRRQGCAKAKGEMAVVEAAQKACVREEKGESKQLKPRDILKRS